MSITLILQADFPLEETLLKLTLEGSRIVIGRGSSCDIRLPDRTVSSRHATIEANHNAHWIMDEGSCNGTFLAGNRIPTHTSVRMQEGQMIQVGKFCFVISFEQQPITPDPAHAARLLALLLVAKQMKSAGEENIPTVYAAHPAAAGLTLSLVQEGKIYWIGNDLYCYRTFRNASIDEQHIALWRTETSVFVRAFATDPPCLLGGRVLKPEQHIVWRSTVPLHIGPVHFTLEEPVALKLAALEQASDEPYYQVALHRIPSLSTSPPLAFPEVSSSLVPCKEREKKEGIHFFFFGVRWSLPDLLVALAAIGIALISTAGLIWLFQG
ncbi:FHA domain-containing protein [Pajaroellobacter abortibovis]|uniref:FHA domain-containing protein n=1 Tax=Pajaroellobacter abortibovis TaxID=1882918 RepID=A0A1L6MUS4_9BACT|nr:FHA domain-containing protein [Pajaroellobacter abortibovis]APR99262.1 hypothetical protein BCY86_00165 [Pajaroellobacter abortibovis]